MKPPMYPISEAGFEMAARLRHACTAYDDAFGTHLEHVARFSGALGRAAGLPEAQIIEILHASPLHDIGKVALPFDVLNKPGKLSPEEMEVVKSHTTIGHRILDNSAWPVVQCAARIALSHHECWDGSGYPHSLRGEAIPLEARIVAVADVYDALLSRRSYKPAWTLDAVIDELRRLRGTKFDPRLLDLFLENLPQPAATVA
jgi:putative two-component system response regulator